MRKKKLIGLLLMLAIPLSLTACDKKYEMKYYEDEAKTETEVFYFEPENQTPYLTKRFKTGENADGEPFRIITLTDLHLGKNDEANTITLTVLSRTIDLERPDLIVLTGDLTSEDVGLDKAKLIAELMEEKQQYWAMILGNHDGEGETNEAREEFVSFYSSYPHCLAKSGPEEIFGSGNYLINVKNSKDEILQTLVFMDTGNSHADAEISKKYNLKHKDGYDYIKPDQIEWYKNTLRKQAEYNGGILPESILFIHIPLPEYNKAYKKNKLFGDRLEKECPPKVNTGMFDAIKSVGSTKTVVAGHDHVNTYCGELDGIRLMYSLSSSFGSYHSRKGYGFKIFWKNLFGEDYKYADGHTIFRIKEGEVTVTHRWNQEIEGIFDGLEAEIESVGFTKTLPKK